jgi:hypothetical protein
VSKTALFLTLVAVSRTTGATATICTDGEDASMKKRRRIPLLLVLLLLPGSRLLGQRSPRPSDPLIGTTLAVAMPTGAGSGPILVDVHIENQGRRDVRKCQFDQGSSCYGLPDFQLVSVPGGDQLNIPPGLFTDRAGAWDSWYLPALGVPGDIVPDLVLPAGGRVHLLHGDLRLMLKDAEEFCRQALIRDRVHFEGPDQAATKKEYENIVRFAGRFRTGGGTYDVTVWAYSQSNTVRLQVGPAR